MPARRVLSINTTPSQAAEQRAILGDAPEWAYHLHDCLHEAKRIAASNALDLKRQREVSIERWKMVDVTLGGLHSELSGVALSISTLVALMGEESEDGDGGKGLVGEIRRAMKRVKSLEADRNIFRGGVIMLAAMTAAIAVFFKAWVMSLINGTAK